MWLCLCLVDADVREDAVLREIVELLQIRQVLVTCTDLDLYAVGLEVAVVEPRTLREHGNHALAGLLALYERRDVVVETLATTTNETPWGYVEADTARMKELAFVVRLLVGPPMAGNATPRMFLKLRVEVTEADGRLGDAFAEDAAGLATLLAPALPGGGSAVRKRCVAGTIAAVGAAELTKLDH